MLPDMMSMLGKGCVRRREEGKGDKECGNKWALRKAERHQRFLVLNKIPQWNRSQKLEEEKGRL